MQKKSGSSNNNTGHLKIHEWISISILVVLVLSLTIMVYMSQDGSSGDSETALYKKRSGFDVLLKGAVKYPGMYRIHSSISMKDILEIAEVLPEADLRRYKLENMISKARVITVPALTLITLHLSGAVKNPGKLVVPKGTSLEQLVEKIEFSENADIKKMKRKRKLKNEEKVIVPVLDVP